MNRDLVIREERHVEPRLRPALSPAAAARLEHLMHLRRWRRQCQTRVAHPSPHVSLLARREWASAHALVADTEAALREEATR